MKILGRKRGKYMDNLYKLKSFDELMKEINLGMDIEFYIYGTRYNISWRADKPFICTCPNGEAVFYDTPEDMFMKYEVDGKPLMDIWKDFEIMFM
jgi:hypothetical protein